MTSTAGQAGHAAIDQITYDDLYARWERGNWRATEIDLSQDAVDWREKLDDVQRRSALWLYTLFFHGEDAVADNLSPYIDAAPREEQKYFLATQQADEARHAVLFHRFMAEVVGVDRGGDVAGTLAATRNQLTWGHRRVFGRLDEVADRLRTDRSPTQLAAAVTLYHLIVEGTLAQPGQHMIERHLEDQDLMPGFRQGMRMVALDEQRHIAFGVRLLTDLYREQPAAIQEAIVGELRETLPDAILVPRPPGWDASYTEAFGFTLQELAEEGMRSLELKLRSIGLPVDDLPGLPIDMSLPIEQRARRGLLLARCNLLGPDRPVVRDPEAIEVFFDSIARTTRPGVVPHGTTILWDFTDHEPWHLTLDGTAHAAPGTIARPTVRLRARFDDWADVAAERTSVPSALLRRRLRPSGDPRVLLRMGRLFGL